jgi:hypothetical protein
MLIYKHKQVKFAKRGEYIYYKGLKLRDRL